ncbi:MAG: type II toxin-antitoxin system YafQ family toxin [Coriobacteriales bacterium]|nr:type II toxin-antitoxin system YafQ family toxin [Coriobacteriales bacterium]
MREIRHTSRFKKDYKAAVRRGSPKTNSGTAIDALANDRPLPERCRPHMLSGDWTGHWECHIRSDWLLIYKLTDDVMVLTLVRTGTHSDLFNE